MVHALMGLAWQRLDDAGRAVEEFKRAIELAPADGKNHFYLGELYRRGSGQKRRCRTWRRRWSSTRCWTWRGSGSATFAWSART
ncbi:hypothetical protein ACN28S_18090 [Cystobacter fuscus]